MEYLIIAGAQSKITPTNKKTALTFMPLNNQF